MEKHDLPIKQEGSHGGTNLRESLLRLLSDDSVAIGNDTYTKGQTITVTDEEGNIDGCSFVGHYAVREEAANNYYTMTTDQIHYWM
ncbi:MAG: hypothetical protein ACLRZ6_10280 [Lachnospiraceae bacterium]